MCINSNYEESICSPVLQRCDTDPKDCLIYLLTVYFSHLHIRLNLHSPARCETGQTVVCIQIWNVSSLHRRTEKHARSGRLCSMDLLFMSCHPPTPRSTQSLSTSGEETLLCPAFISLQLRDEWNLTAFWCHLLQSPRTICIENRSCFLYRAHF